MTTSVAVIGLGAMGAPMAHRLHDAGLGLIVCDRSEAALAPFADLGVTVVREPARCADADIVLVLVATSAQVQDVVLGENGLVAGLSGARLPLVAVMSTVPSETVTSLQDALLAHRLRVVDAPISGGSLRAVQGRLSVMVGGAAEDVDRLRPVLQAFATDVFHCGQLGQGETVKIINNIVGVAAAAITAEACRIALDQGLDLDLATAVFDASTGRSYLTAEQGEATASYARFASDRTTFDSLAAIMRKDIALATNLATHSPGSFPLIEGLSQFVNAIGDETYDNWHEVGRAHRGDSE